MNAEVIKNILLGVAVTGTVVNTGMIMSQDDAPPPAPVVKKEIQATNAAPSPPIINTQNPQPVATPTPAVPDPVTGPTSSIKFEAYKHNFGNVAPGSSSPHTFKFVNTGDVPLTISDARASCGCTVPEWPKEPIPPNGTGELKVVFTPKETQMGVQNKTVTVTANIPTKTVQLNIEANVVEG